MAIIGCLYLYHHMSLVCVYVLSSVSVEQGHGSISVSNASHNCVTLTLLFLVLVNKELPTHTHTKCENPRNTEERSPSKMTFLSLLTTTDHSKKTQQWIVKYIP